MSLEHISPVWKRTFPLTIVRGEGCYVFDMDGNRYLDFTSGIGVVNTGHCHPEIVSAAKEQVEAQLAETIAQNPEIAGSVKLDAAASEVAGSLSDGLPVDQAETVATVRGFGFEPIEQVEQLRGGFRIGPVVKGQGHRPLARIAPAYHGKKEPNSGQKRGDHAGKHVSCRRNKCPAIIDHEQQGHEAAGSEPCPFSHRQARVFDVWFHQTLCMMAMKETHSHGFRDSASSELARSEPPRW